MTIPTLVANYQNKAWNTSAQVFERKLEEALRQMNTQQVLAGYKSTADFVNALGKYFKITKVCQNDDIMSCFEDKVYWGADEEEIDMTNIKNAKNFGQEDWDTETIGVQFANGTTGLIAYNPKCTEQPFTNQFNGTSCLAILYDTTGFKTPNTQLKDLRSINVISLDRNKCVIDLGSVCFTAPFEPEPLTKAECETLKNGNLGIKECFYQRDYWASAVKTCGGVDKIPNAEQLAILAEYIYGKPINSSGANYNVTWDREKIEELGFDAIIDSGYTFSLWSNNTMGGGSAWTRMFSSGHTTFWESIRSNSYGAVCVAD